MKPTLVIFLHSHRYDRLYQAMSMLLTASSMGWKCHLFLFYHALASYMKGSWDDVNVASLGPETGTPAALWVEEMTQGFETHNFPSLYDMLDKAREESGGVNILACSSSCKVLNLDHRLVREKVSEVVGLPTMMGIAEKATHVLYV